MTLKERIFRSIRWNSVRSAFLFAGSIIQLVILVRFIDQRDFGMMAILNVYASFVYIFIELGLGNAIIYQKEPSQKQLSTIFYLIMIVGLLFSIATAATGWIAISLNFDVEMGILLIWYSPLFLLRGMVVLYSTLLKS